MGANEGRLDGGSYEVCDCICPTPVFWIVDPGADRSLEFGIELGGPSRREGCALLRRHHLYIRANPAEREHLHREMPSKIYRDTQGRTRREVEQTSPSTGQKLVTVLINDPVSNRIIILDPRTMTARVRDGSISAPLKQAVRSKPEDGLTPPAASTGDAEPAAPTSESAAEELGTQVMQGLKVKGTKIITRLPPAVQGNTQPRMLVVSTWSSEELHVDVLKDIVEAGENHRTIRLVNIVRTEPDAELFKIPSGYATVDSRSH